MSANRCLVFRADGLHHAVVVGETPAAGETKWQVIADPTPFDPAPLADAVAVAVAAGVLVLTNERIALDDETAAEIVSLILVELGRVDV